MEAAIEKNLGYKPLFVKLKHYTPRGKFGEGEIKELIENIESNFENSKG